MAAATVRRSPGNPFLYAKPILADTIRSKPVNPTVFEAEKHLAFVEKPDVLTMKDLSLPEDLGISPVAVSQPFLLFNEEAISIMRDEILSPDVWDNCLQSSEFAGCQLRGYCPKYAPFMYKAWKNPKTLSIISDIAQVDLIPAFDIEIGNINVSVAEQSDRVGEEPPVTKWHHDSYPFVCVVMMSDASRMKGGETALKCGTSEILKIRGPQMGCAIVLQGRCISHQALAAVGGTERITMVTAFRPRDAMVPDDSVLTTIRPITDHNELYFQWTQYRVEVLEERLRRMRKELEEDYQTNRPTNVKRIKAFLKQQQEWLTIANDEIVEV